MVDEQFFRQVDRMFRGTGFRVVTLKYGQLLRAVFEQPGGRYALDAREARAHAAGRSWLRVTMDATRRRPDRPHTPGRSSAGWMQSTTTRTLP